MGKNNKDSKESKKVEEESNTVCLFCYLVEGMDDHVSKDMWLVMNDTTMTKAKAHQTRWFPGEEYRTIIIDKGVSYDTEKRSFTEAEFKREFKIEN